MNADASTDAGSEQRSPLLNAGQDVYVLAGPVAASGYQWYEVDPTMGTGTYFTPGFDAPPGWVAASRKACPGSCPSAACVRTVTCPRSSGISPTFTRPSGSFASVIVR